VYPQAQLARCSNLKGFDAPRSGLTCWWGQGESTGCAPGRREQGDLAVGEPNDIELDAPKVRARMQFVFARTVREALDAAFGEGTLPWRSLTPVVESGL
jgi:hypothetical protein